MPHFNKPASVAPPSASNRGLYDPAFERDSCGVGFVADMSGRKSHATIQSGLQVLKNLQHRGACGCDQDTGDGAGILMQLPDLFFRSDNTSLSDRLPAAGDYGVAFVFLPRGGAQRLICHRTLEAVVAAEGQKMLGWRDVPVVSSAIGWLARSQEPVMEQLFIGRGEGTAAGDQFERKLYVIRRRAEKWAYSESIGNDALGFAIASCSARTIVYKGMLKPDQLPAYFPDLGDSRLESALALVHSRYSTNTFPRWGLAQPFHLLAHNGEINTLQGNLHWMKARQSRMRSRVLGADLDKALPLDFEGMSDSAALDQVLALLVQAGRSLPHALMMLVPEAYEGDRSIDPARRAFYQYHSGLLEPWDGPASLVFCDGIRIGAMLDRNGLRPGRYVVTHDNLVVLASEVGVLPIPPEAIRLSGRLQPGKIFLVDLAVGRIIGDEELKESICRAQPYGLWLEKHQINLGDLPEPAAVPRCQSRHPAGPPAGIRLHPGGHPPHPPAHGPGRQGAGLEHGYGYSAGGAQPAQPDLAQLLQAALRPGDQPADRPDPREGCHEHRVAPGFRAEPARRIPGACTAAASQVSHAQQCRAGATAGGAVRRAFIARRYLDPLRPHPGRGRSGAGARSALCGRPLRRWTGERRS